MVMFDILISNGKAEDAKGKDGLERKLGRTTPFWFQVLKQFSFE